MERTVLICGQKAKIGCDEKCSKAWGINNRPTAHVSEGPEDFYWLSDSELGEAPIDPGTYEGGCAKPRNKEQRLNKWCARECERCAISEPNEHDKPLVFIDWSKRFYNL